MRIFKYHTGHTDFYAHFSTSGYQGVLDPVHFGMMMVLNRCIGLCTPPVRSVLSVGVGIAKTTIEKAVRPLLPLFIAMILILFLLTYFPELSLWLPRQFGF